LVRLDLAAAHIQEREVDQACATITEALSIPATHWVDLIRRRAWAVLADLTPWDDHPAVRDLREQTVPILAS
jgi:hypothetical protein